MSDDRRHDLLAAGVLVAVITLYFLDVILGRGVFYLRDVSLYHFPLGASLRAVVGGGELPYWNPFLSGGQPLAANPAYRLFYPPTWLLFLPGFVYGFNLHALLHVYLAAFGTYALLRSFATSRAAGVLGALSFALGGFVLTGLSLFPFLFSAAWLPWTCLFTRRFLEHRDWKDFAFASSCLGMQLLVGEPVTVVQTGLLLGLYALFRKSRFRDLGAIAAICVTALLLSSVQTLPAIDHARDSVRAAGFNFSTVIDWSTPPQRLMETVYPAAANGALYPGHTSPYVLSIYSGVAIAVLALAGLAAGGRGRWLYATTIAVSLLLSFGRYTPLWRWLYDFGLARSIRYPEKFLILGIFATVVFGALAADELLRGNARIRVVAIGLAVAVAGVAVLGQTPADILRALLLAVILAATLRIRRELAVLLLGAFVLVDLLALLSVAPRVPPAFYTTPPPVLRHLAPNRDAYRVFNVGNWLEQSPNRRGYAVLTPERFLIERNALTGYIANTYGVHTAIDADYDLTALRTSSEFAKATWELRMLSPRWLDYVAAMSNVRYVAVYRPVEQARVEAHGDPRIIEPIRFVEGLARPRYSFASDLATARDRKELVMRLAGGRYDTGTAFIPGAPFQPAPGKVLRTAESANRAVIEVETAGVAFLVMSVTAHKYWSVTIDGAEVPSIVTNLTYQGVAVPRGRHVVEMRYRNPLIAAGAAVSLATLLALLFVVWRRRAAIRMRNL